MNRHSRLALARESDTISLEAMRGMPVHAVDAHVGRIDRFYVDTRAWRVRYALVQLGESPGGAPVLVPMFAFDAVDPGDSCLYVQLSLDQLAGSPPFDGGACVSRDYEHRLHRHHGWPRYWEALAAPHREEAASDRVSSVEAQTAGPLRHDVLLGYPVQASDGAVLGRTADLLAAVRDWRIRALRLDAGHGGSVTVPGGDRIDAIDHARSRIVVRAGTACGRAD